MRKCEAFGCSQAAAHYTSNPSSKRNFHLCWHHNEYHHQGIAFDLDTHIPGNADPAVLTGSGATAILTLPAHTIATAEEAPMAYGHNNILSTLTDARSELEDGIQGARDRISELEDAISDMEGALGSVSEAIDALENIDGFSVQVDVEELSVGVSIDF